MIDREAKVELLAALGRQAAVAILGPRQSGKTTLAIEVQKTLGGVYLDLEDPRDLAKLEDPIFYLENHADRLVILDEVQRVPDLFAILRGIIDRGRRAGSRTGRFLLLGSTSAELLRQSESLAGRIEYLELGSLLVSEATRHRDQREELWLRGGFPDSLLAATDRDSLKFRLSLIRAYLEHEIPMLTRRPPTELIGRLWTMIAHSQGSPLNASRLAGGLGVSSPIVANYVGLLVDLMLVRRLPPLFRNVGKRLTKSPKLYIRDSGLVHALLGIESLEDLLAHPIAGPSWEGFAIENLIMSAPSSAFAGFWRTHAGAEIDLVLELGGKQGIWGIEIKRSANSRPSKGFHQAATDLEADRKLLVHPGDDRFAQGQDVEVLGLADLCTELASLR